MMSDDDNAPRPRAQRVERGYYRGAVKRLEKALERGQVESGEALAFARRVLEVALNAGDMRAAATAAKVVADIEASLRDAEAATDRLAVEAIKLEDADLHHLEKLGGAPEAQAKGDTHVHIHTPTAPDARPAAEAEAEKQVG